KKLGKNIEIKQFYLSFLNKNSLVLKQLKQIVQAPDDENINDVRVRFEKFNGKNTCFLTLKTKGDFIRNEYQKQISSNLATFLVKKFASTFVEKQRTLFTYESKNHNLTLNFEFDEYKTPIINSTVEVEVQNKSISKSFIEKLLKDYFKLSFTDITRNNSFKNKNLSVKLNNNISDNIL
ncbi:MAG: hypothetical protein KBT30_00830, partial [Clostridiales bacterium]|nr:hypothetical protein [Candidatus Apopatousia equi]